MGKFLLNLGFRWSGLPSQFVDGYVFNPSGLNREQASRREFEYVQGQWLMFDPQMYLSVLDGGMCTKTCANLATYPWFGVETPAFDSSEMKVTQWMSQVKGSVNWDPVIAENDEDIRRIVQECLQFQIDFGVTHLIAPTPLLDNSDDQFGTQLKWLDAASQLRDESQLPVFATVAVMDYLLSTYEPPKNPLLQTIIDNIAVSEFEGVYLLVVQEDTPRTRITDKHVVESLLYATRILSEHSNKEVIVNFADDLGYTCIAVGASGFVGGTTSKSRRLCLSDFIDRSGGAAYPKFYSNSLIGDLSIDDMRKIRDARLLRLIADDVTTASESLFKALQAGDDPNEVPAWRQTRNNVKEANIHRVLLMPRVKTELDKLGIREKTDTILYWLQEAEAHVKLMESRFDSSPLSEDGRHVEVWRMAFEAFLNQVDKGET